MNFSRRAGLAARHALLLLAAVGLLAVAPMHAAAAEGIEYHPGKLTWFDLVTDDLDAARKFYGEVFGWTFRTVGEGPGSYTYAELAGTPIAGMLRRPAPAGAQRNARWLVLISVGDPAAAVRYVQEQGGATLVAPATIPGRGTHALLRDPDGAVFGVLKSERGDGPDAPVESGDFFWADLLALDPARAARFYGGLAGYEISAGGNDAMTRTVLSAGGYARAGIGPKPDVVKQPGWLPYVLVDDVAATLAKVAAAGGSVLVPARDDVLDGNLAVIADPRGGVVGIIRWQDIADDGQGDRK